MIATKKNFLYAGVLLIALYFLFAGLYEAKTLFAPLATAVVLSLLVMPLSVFCEKHSVKRWVAALINAFLLFLLSLGFLALIGTQIGNFAKDWPKVKDRIKPQIEQLKEVVASNTPLKKKQLSISPETAGSPGKASLIEKKLGPMLSGLISFSGNFLLTFVYVFFILTYRRKFRIFLIHIFPDEKRDLLKEVIKQSAKVVPQYLFGKLLLMALNAVFYAVGLGLAGVRNFLLISIISAVLTLIPYIGNIVGFGLAMVFGYLSSSDPMIFVWIILTFSITQFIETYIFTPYVIGDKVDLHPFFVIIVVIIGNMLWGIIGMVLAVPLSAVLTIILLHIKETKELGRLLSKKGFEGEEA